MSTVSAPGNVKCNNCGSSASGKFCGNCGAELQPEVDTFARAIGGDILGIGRDYGFIGVLGRLVRSPIKATVALANDHVYQGHWNFLLTATTIWLVLFNLSLWLANEPSMPQFEPSMSQLLKVWLYVYFFVLLAVGYFIFRRLAPEPRSPRAYVKLSCVSAGFFQIGLLLYLFVSIGAMLPILLVALSAVPPESASETIRIYDGAATIIVILIFISLAAYIVRVQKHFWNLSFGRAVLAFVLIPVVGLGALVTVLTIILFPLLVLAPQWSEPLIKALTPLGTTG